MQIDTRASLLWPASRYKQPLFTGLGAVVLCLVLASERAQARTRDDVMGSAFQCGHLGDDRAWLDCLYGAAQPVRSELGLPPAPGNQAMLLEQASDPNPSKKSALRDEVLGGIAHCYDVANDRVWLDCYYQSTQPMRVSLGLTPLSGISKSAVGSAELPATQARPGSSGLLTGFIPSEHSRFVSRVTSYSFDADGRFTVTLANGQTWKQSPADDAQARWKKPANAYLATVSPGAFGSTNFRVQDNPHQFKVRPVN